MEQQVDSRGVCSTTRKRTSCYSHKRKASCHCGAGDRRPTWPAQPTGGHRQNSLHFHYSVPTLATTRGGTRFSWDEVHRHNPWPRSYFWNRTGLVLAHPQEVATSHHQSPLYEVLTLATVGSSHATDTHLSSSSPSTRRGLSTELGSLSTAEATAAGGASYLQNDIGATSCQRRSHHLFSFSPLRF